MIVAVLATAVVLAVITNVVVYVIVTGPLGEPLVMCSMCSSIPPGLSPMDIDEPVIFSAIFGVGAVVVYAVIGALSTRSFRVFAIAATVVLVASLGLPAKIPSPPVEWSAKLTLVAMPVVGYTVIMGVLCLGHARGWLTSRRLRRPPLGT